MHTSDYLKRLVGALGLLGPCRTKFRTINEDSGQPHTFPPQSMKWGKLRTSAVVFVNEARGRRVTTTPCRRVCAFCRELLEGSSELRLMLCREKFQGNKKGTSVVAACGEQGGGGSGACGRARWQAPARSARCLGM